MTAKGREIRAVAAASVTASDDALAGSKDGVVADAAPWATRPNLTNSQTPTPNPMSAPSGPMLKKEPIATPASRSGRANAITGNARPNHPASMPTTPEREAENNSHHLTFNGRLNAVYARTPSAVFQASSGVQGPTLARRGSTRTRGAISRCSFGHLLLY